MFSLHKDSKITLISTIVSPSFDDGILVWKRVSITELPAMLARVTENLNGHAATVNVLRDLCPSLPEAKRGFWDGSTLALGVRPAGGVRGAGATGDTPVTLDTIEVALIKYTNDLSGLYGYYIG